MTECKSKQCDLSTEGNIVCAKMPPRESKLFEKNLSCFKITGIHQY